mmetsp:Transcript_2869/g.10149  ORF Transcript_2869/g.10149 Transcript_2869/m.10149 type:complete len:243 (+) Transcript_2869:304-1032(+)
MGEYSIFSPAAIMDTSRPLAEYRSQNSCTVMSPSATTSLSHELKPSGTALTGPPIVTSNSHDVTFFGGIGSDMANMLMARLPKELRMASSGAAASALYSSMETRPVVSAVVVAMAGMMRPTICFALSASASGMLYCRARRLPVAAMKSMWPLPSSSFSKSATQARKPPSASTGGMRVSSCAAMSSRSPPPPPSSIALALASSSFFASSSFSGILSVEGAHAGGSYPASASANTARSLVSAMP